jgi:hypothetical protein
MKLTLVILAFLISQNLFAQHDWKSANWNKGSIGFGCGINADMTIPVINMSKLLIEKDFKSIKDSLFSNTPANQFITVFVLEKLKKKKIVVLDSLEEAQIKIIKNSENLVSVCAGCNYFGDVPLKTLLDPKEDHVIYRDAGYWFKHYYKTK